MALEISAMRLIPPAPAKVVMGDSDPIKPIPSRPVQRLSWSFDESINKICLAWIDGKSPPDVNLAQETSHEKVVNYLWQGYVRQGITREGVSNIQRVAPKAWDSLRGLILKETYCNWRERKAPIIMLPCYYARAFRINKRALQYYLLSAIGKDQELDKSNQGWFPGFFLDPVNCFGFLLLKPTISLWHRSAVCQMRGFLNRKYPSRKEYTIWEIKDFISRYSYEGLEILVRHDLMVYRSIRRSVIESLKKKAVEITVKEITPPQSEEVPSLVPQNQEVFINQAEGASVGHYKFFPSLQSWRPLAVHLTLSRCLLTESFNNQNFRPEQFKDINCPFFVTVIIRGKPAMFEVAQTLEVFELDLDDPDKFLSPPIPNLERLINMFNISAVEL